MATKVGSLIAELGLDTARFQAGIKTATNTVTRFNRKAERAFQRFNRTAGIAATGAAAAYATAFGVMTKQTLDLADQLAKLETRLGVSVEAMSALKFAGEQSGVSFQTLTMGMQRMIRRVGEAANGTGEAEAALIELGISAKELADLRPENQFRAIAKALSGVADSNDKARLAQKLFDSEGVSLLQMFENGATGLDEYMARANELGVVMSHTTAKGAKEAKNALGEVKAVMNASAQEAMINMIPAITDVANTLATVLPEASAIATGAFFKIREVGLGVLSLMINRYATFKAIVADALKAVGFDDMATNERQGIAGMIEFSKTLLDSSNKAGAAAAKAFANTNREIANIPIEKIDNVDSAFGRVNLTTAKMIANMKSIGERIEVDIFDKSQSVFGQMADSFKDAVKKMVNTWINSQLQNMFSNFGKNAGGEGSGGSFLSSFIKALPGFASGGSFTVGGRGGTDSNIVAFRATKGEAVTIQTPQQQAMGGSPVVLNVTNNFNGGGGAPDATLIKELDRRDIKIKSDIANSMRRKRF